MELDASTTARLARLIDQQDIRDVIYRYCRGIDRRDFDLVRSCYHPDATDDHGDFRGTIDEFIPYVTERVQRFERTMHFVGNVLVEVDGDRARSESYTVAYHRVAASSTKPERDFTVNLRYVDDLKRRNGEWRIATRVCVLEFSRIDPVTGSWPPSPESSQGRFGGADAVFAPSLVGWNPSSPN
jgi:3-phenylpropionate/cinnamic acid dioxygenase small subunit